ncbi:MAG: hypothetical protein LBQ24_07545 [Candidatus Peribacteria bacterium]|nr:hypothetical protein [Candidatus Peribacteria bacterium]
MLTIFKELTIIFSSKISHSSMFVIFLLNTSISSAKISQSTKSLFDKYLSNVAFDETTISQSNNFQLEI